MPGLTALLLAPALACAQQGAPQAGDGGDDATILREVEVRGERDRLPPPEFDTRQSTTTRTAEDLRRSQPATVFEAVRDVPGVSVTGGPRASGMTFNIRGYSDNEDVQVKLDGVPKGFEKYRFGGIFIEPELLKAIEVQRGPQIQSGSGSLGGTIAATTRDAADYLAPGERVGAQLKLARATNNNEDLRSWLFYARPTGNTDVVAGVMRRESGDIRLSDGARLELSSANAHSKLLKGSVVLGDWLLSTSWVDLTDASLQPYDATGGQAGLFGTVNRAALDSTRSLSVEYAPGNPWINLKAVIGEARTRMVDTHRPGQSIFANNTTGTVIDTYDYHNRTVDISNRSRVEGLPFGLEILAGAQWVESERDVTRFREKIPSNGFDASIPPGIKAYLAGYLQPRFTFGRLEVIPGARLDRYEIEATGGTRAVLETARESTRIAFEKATGSLGLVYQLAPARLIVFYNLAEAFRPPLVDEYFTQGAFSRCATFLLGAALAPKSQVCGALYRPQEATNQELGVTWSEALPAWRARLDAKVTLLRIQTRHLLRSLQAVSATEVGQPGHESRHGFEIESSLRAARGYVRGSYARLRGTVDEGGGKTRSNPQPLYNAPGDTLNLSAGFEPMRGVEVGVSYQQVDARRVIVATVGTTNVIGMQPGYRLWGAHVRVQLGRHVELRVSGENLGNEKYNLANGFGGSMGFEAPGINLRMALIFKV